MRLGFIQGWGMGWGGGVRPGGVVGGGPAKRLVGAFRKTNTLLNVLYFT
jgi:hypothetical protein